MSFITLPTGKLHKKADFRVDFTVTSQIMFIARLIEIFMEELPTIQTYHRMMFRNIFWQLVILSRECKMILVFTLRVKGLTMLVLDKN